MALVITDNKETSKLLTLAAIAHSFDPTLSTMYIRDLHKFTSKFKNKTEKIITDSDSEKLCKAEERRKLKNEKRYKNSLKGKSK